MPKRRDIKKILVVGAGPIIIGQACEFDYSGTQACPIIIGPAPTTNIFLISLLFGIFFHTHNELFK